jgi:hypothetical protein
MHRSYKIQVRLRTGQTELRSDSTQVIQYTRQPERWSDSAQLRNDTEQTAPRSDSSSNSRKDGPDGRKVIRPAGQTLHRS